MTKPFRDESTEEGRKLWKAIDKAASKCPEWVKFKIEKAIEDKFKNKKNKENP